MTITALIYFVFIVAIVCAVIYGLWWVLGKVPMAPPIRILVTVIFCFLCVLVILNYIPAGLIPQGNGRLFRN